jgi:hypothetical protein
MQQSWPIVRFYYICLEGMRETIKIPVSQNSNTNFRGLCKRLQTMFDLRLLQL